MHFVSRAAFAMLVILAGLPAAASEPPVRGAPRPDVQPTVSPEPAPLDAALAVRLGMVPRGMSVRDRRRLAGLQAFYAARNHAPVWTTAGGLTRRAEIVLGELGRSAEWGLSAIQPGVADIAALAAGGEPDALAQAELAVSRAALDYAREARSGRVEPAAVSEFIDRQPRLKEASALLEELAAAEDPAAYLRALHPRHPEFERLRRLALALEAALALPAQEQGSPEPARRKARRPAERPEAAQLRKVKASMEQWRWMPDDLGNLHVSVNIPEFTLRVVKDGRVIHTERVIVGKTDTPTPVFSNAMQTVVFQPNWYVPPSIKEEELLPALARGSNILQRRGLKVQRGGKDVDASRIDWLEVDPRNYVFYQPSGPANALGQVKFLFPNRHDVYMHDTPGKGLFNASIRTFSHGCVRVRNPLKLAALVLGEDKAWPEEQIDALAKAAQPNSAVALERKIPVHITYFTASVDADGKATFAGDIYGHDARLLSGLNGQVLLAQSRAKSKAKFSPPEIARSRQQGRPQLATAPWQPQPVPPRRSSSSDRGWMRNALNNRY
jgi:murein L,D-transpeptidase YcbB/YkuD